jgi:hypothetical protein
MLERIIKALPAIALFVIVDGLLWYYSVTAPDQVRPALVAAASAWGVAIVGILATWIGAFRSANLEQEAAFTTSRRTAYAQLLAFADEFVDSQASLRSAQEGEKNARESLDNATQKQSASLGDKALEEAAIQANAAYGIWDARLSSASAKVKDLIRSYQQAAATVELLAPACVITHLQPFIKSLADCSERSETVRKTAREEFVAAIRMDLGLSAETRLSSAPWAGLMGPADRIR